MQYGIKSYELFVILNKDVQYLQSVVVTMVIVFFSVQTVDIQSRNYPAGLERCKAMADSCNFSEISPFMPGIKLLLQLGIQLDL